MMTPTMPVSRLVLTVILLGLGNCSSSTSRIFRIRKLPAGESVGGDSQQEDNIFIKLNETVGGGVDDSDANEGGENATECVRPDQYGDFGAETPHSDSVLVAWTYQLQGLVDMTPQTVKEQVIPLIEKELAAKLIERFFNSRVCEENDSPAMDLLGGGDRKQRKSRILQTPTRVLQPLKAWSLENGSKVTGLLIEPRDTILNGHEGVLCEDTEWIQGAKRCFRLLGGVTFTGSGGDIDEAVEFVQNAIRSIMNDEQALDWVHSSLRNVYYVAAETDYHEYFGRENITVPTVAPATPTTSSDEDKTFLEKLDNPQDWSVWAWILVVGGVFLVVLALFIIRQRREAKKGSFREQIYGRRKREKRLRLFGSDSGGSNFDDESSDDFMPSLTWRQARLASGDIDLRSEGGGSIKSVHSALSNDDFFDVKPEQVPVETVTPRDFAPGFPFSGSVKSGNVSIYESASSGYSSSGYGSSIHSGRAKAAEEDTDDGSSSNSNDSTPPVPAHGRPWRRNII